MKNFKMIHIRKITFVEVFETQFSPRDPILENVLNLTMIIL